MARHKAPITLQVEDEAPVRAPTPEQVQAALTRMTPDGGPGFIILGKVQYGDVKISLFQVQIDGHTFGLVDASEPEEGYLSIHLLPDDLAFFEPWDGTYDT